MIIQHKNEVKIFLKKNLWNFFKDETCNISRFYPKIPR